MALACLFLWCICILLLSSQSKTWHSFGRVGQNLLCCMKQQRAGGVFSVWLSSHEQPACGRDQLTCFQVRRHLRPSECEQYSKHCMVWPGSGGTMRAGPTYWNEERNFTRFYERWAFPGVPCLTSQYHNHWPSDNYICQKLWVQRSLFLPESHH